MFINNDFNRLKIINKISLLNLNKKILFFKTSNNRWIEVII